MKNYLNKQQDQQGHSSSEISAIYHFVAEGISTGKVINYYLMELTSNGICPSFEYLRTDGTLEIPLKIDAANATYLISSLAEEQGSAYVWRKNGFLYTGVTLPNDEAVIFEILESEQRVRAYYSDEHIIKFMVRFSDQDDERMQTSLRSHQNVLMQNILDGNANNF